MILDIAKEGLRLEARRNANIHYDAEAEYDAHRRDNYAALCRAVISLTDENARLRAEVMRERGTGF